MTLKPGLSRCPCGHLAIAVDKGEFICARCKQIEDRMEQMQRMAEHRYEADVDWRHRARIRAMSGLPVYRIANAEIARGFGL